MIALFLSCAHINGKDKKSGDPYDYYKLHFALRSKRMNMPDVLTAETCNLGAGFPPDFSFPCVCEVEFDRRGYMQTYKLLSSDPEDFNLLFFSPDSSVPGLNSAPAVSNKSK